jgi:hypothetical protein
MEPPVFNPGSILVNTATNKLYGVLVATLPNLKIIVFRLDKNTHPIFSKFELHDNIAKVGIINEGQYANLKSALLRHYRTTNLTPTEKKMLQPLMNFAFPLGIPEYDPGAELPERDITAMDLNSKLEAGARLYINTPPKSCYNHLDGKICTLIARNQQGIWVRMPSNDPDMTKLGNSLAFLFYRNPDVPSFSGISRITPVLDSVATGEAYGHGHGYGHGISNSIGMASGNSAGEDAGSSEDNTDLVRETFKKMQDADELTTTMEFNGDKVRVVPKTMRVIMPEIYSGMVYNPVNDTFIAPPDVITPSLAAKLGNSLILGTRGQSGVVTEMNGADNELAYNTDSNGIASSGWEIQPENKVSMDGELIYEGGARSGRKTDEFAAELEDIEKEEASYGNLDAKSSTSQELRTGNIDDIIIADVDETRESLRDMVENEEEYRELLHGASILLDTPDRKQRQRKDSEGKDSEGKDSEGKDSDGDGDKSDISSITSHSNGKDESTDGEATDYDEETFAEVLDDSEVGEGEVFEKVRIIEVGELERKYPLQKGDIINYKIEKIPPLLRENARARIIKQVNIISLLKERITGSDDNILFQPADYKPLVEKYMRCDFGNKFLIPLVINKKKIYLEGGGAGKHTKITKDDFDTNTNEVIEGYYENIAMINTLQDKKNISINNDAYTNQILTALNPTTVAETDQLGLLFRLGAEVPSSDYKKLQADTLTIRYCDKPMKCQSYALSAMNFDYQVNLGPMGRFINYEEDVGNKGEEDEELISAEKDILQDVPQFEIYYQGDLIRIIGYLRPPLEYFNSSKGIGKDTMLLDSFQKAKNAGNVITVNLEDLNDEVIDDENEQIDITQHPEKFVLFMMPNDIAGNWDWMQEKLAKIIPDVDAIMKLYFNNNKAEEGQLERIYDILDKFEYDSRSLNYATQDLIFNKNADLVEHYVKFNQKMQDNITRYRHEQKVKDKDTKKDSRKDGVANEEDDKKFRYITNSIMDDIGKFYYEKYENRGISVDTDDIRLRWFMNGIDNGRYFFKTLFMNYLKSYQEGAKLESLETELTLLRDKHAIFSQSRPIPGSAGSIDSSGAACASKSSTGPNIIKYPNLARLEQDNGKVAVDSDGNVIMAGDYALVEHEGAKILYKRELISNVDMWIKEDLAVLYKLIQDKKSKCTANPEIKLEAANTCVFDMEAIKCEPNIELDAMKQSLDMERVISDLQKQIEYIRHLPVLIAALDKEIHQDRGILLNRLNNMKRYWRDKEEYAKKQDEEIQKTIRRGKDCIHFKVTDYFFKIAGAGEDRYQFVRPILRNFLNVEPGFDKDFRVFHPENAEDNFAHCNICNQTLICNHWRLGASYLEDNKPIDYEKIIDVFATEIDGGFHCMACEEFIGNTAVLDVDDFEKGEGGKMIRTREVMEDIPLVEKQKQYIDNLITDLVEEEPSMRNEDLQSKINMFNLLKRVCGLEMLSIVDEVEMINFLKGYQFITKNNILNKLAQQLGRGNLPFLVKKTEQLYMIYLWCDIAARLLIILQTTRTPYELRNKSCNTNIVGYPLIDDVTASAGIDFIICVLGQIGIIPDYTALADLKPDNFIKQLRKQVDEDNYVKSKIAAAQNNKVDEINMIYEFEKHNTNRWKTFLPRLNHIQISWTPEKILNEANLKEVSAKNWERMVEVGRENGVFYSLGVMQSVNYVIESSEKPGIVPSISSYCCPYVHDGERQDKFDYLKYFISRDSGIRDNLEYLKKTGDVLMKLYDIRRVGVNNIFYEPLYKPSQTVFRFNLDATPDEIRDVHLKFIDVGINKGHLHVFDKYGRCLISNQFKKDIISKTYTTRDYKHIENAITNHNTIDIQKYQSLLEEITSTNTDQMEMKLIDKLINELPKLDVMNYFRDFLTKIQENYKSIYPASASSSSSASLSSIVKKPGLMDGGAKGDTFSINKHLSQLNAQIAKEIEELVSKLASTDKLIEKYNKILSNMGNFTALYEEYKDAYGMDAGIRFRYTKMEESLHAYLKFLSDVINQIKNRKLVTQIAKEKIRPQFRDFLPYSENVKLFKLIDNFNSMLYNYSSKLHSKNIYKIFYPEMVASMLHYMLVISLANLFNCLDTPRLRNQHARELEYTFIKRPNKDPAIIDYSNDMNIDLVNDDVQLDDDGQPIDLIDNIRMKNSNNLKTIGNFIITYVERISENQILYDSLTEYEINRQVTQDKQNEIENTLRSFEWLNKENNEVNRLLIQMKMNLKQVGYGDVHKYLITEFGGDFLDEENDEYDSGIRKGDGGVDAGEDGERADNEYGMDRYELENELPQLVAYDDLDDGDVDYNFLAVGEED